MAPALAKIWAKENCFDSTILLLLEVVVFSLPPQFPRDLWLAPSLQNNWKHNFNTLPHPSEHTWRAARAAWGHKGGCIRAHALGNRQFENNNTVTPIVDTSHYMFSTRSITLWYEYWFNKIEQKSEDWMLSFIQLLIVSPLSKWEIWTTG